MVLVEKFGDGFLIFVFGDGDELGTHQILYGLGAVGREEISKRHDTFQMLFGIKDVGVIDGFHMRGLVAQVGKCFVSRHFRTKVGVAGAHAAACYIFFIGQQHSHFAMRGAIQEREQAVAIRGGDVLQKVRCVIGGKQTDPDAVFGFRQGKNELGLLTGVKLQEEVIHLTARQGVEGSDASVAGQCGPLTGERFGGRRLHKGRHEFFIVQRLCEALFTGATITQCPYLPG